MLEKEREYFCDRSRSVAIVIRNGKIEREETNQQIVSAREITW